MSYVVLQKDGKFTKYRIGENTRLTIGRALLNDIILEDPHVDPEQLSLEAHPDHTNRFIIHINDATNPVLINKKPAAAQQQEILSGDELIIGRTHVCIYAESHHVETTREFSFTNWIHMHRLKPFITGLMIILMLTASMLYAYLGTYTPIKLSEISIVAIITLSIVFVWSIGWGIAGYIINGKHHISSHMFFAASCMILSLVIGNAHSYMDYIFSSRLIGVISQWCIIVAVWGLMIGFSLTLVSHKKTAMRQGFMYSLFIFSAIAALVFLRQSDYSYQPQHSTTIKSGMVPTTRPVDINEYLESYNKIFDQLDQTNQ